MNYMGADIMNEICFELCDFNQYALDIFIYLYFSVLVHIYC